MSIVVVTLILSEAASAFTPAPIIEGDFAFFDGRTVVNYTDGTEMTFGKRIVGWFGEESTLEVPKELGGVQMEELCSGAVKDRSELTEAILPDAPMLIAGKAFSNCPQLEQVVIYDSLEIEDNPFVNCPALREFVCSSGSTRYGTVDGALCDLQDMTLLTPNGGNNDSFVVPEGIRKLAPFSFGEREDVFTVVLPEGLTEIEGSAFSFSSGLYDVRMPDTASVIGDRAFLACSGLTEVDLPESLVTIGSGAFRGCENLSEIAIPGSCVEIGDKAFSMCDNLGTVYIPSSVQEMGEGVFEDSPNVRLCLEQDSYAEAWAKENGVSYTVQ